MSTALEYVNSRLDHREESSCGVRNWAFENTQLEEKKDKQKKSVEFGTAL